MTEFKESLDCDCLENHENHLCSLVFKEEFEKLENLTKAPAVYCLACKRRANSPENLCNPTNLNP
jgi:hypothetical protein